MKKQMLYKELAEYYDLIYSWKNYKEEVSILKKIITKSKKSKGKRLLDVACGTGQHLRYLKSAFSCTGIDLNKGIVNVAKRKLRGVDFRTGDMLTFNLKQKYDVIICLFSSIGYVKTYQNLKRVIENLARHLVSGGVLIIEPWFTQRTFTAGKPFMTIYDGKDIKIARLEISKIKNNISVLDMHYLIAEKHKPIRHFADRHEVGLFETKRTLAYMKQAKLKVKFLKKGLRESRGLFIGIKK